MEGVDIEKAEDGFLSMLEEVWPNGYDDEHLVDTPRRVVKMYQEFFNAPEPNITLFNTDSNELVLLREIPFYSLCAHHWLPFYGRAHVAYIPNGKIIGLSKIPRIIDYFSHSPQVQERLTSDIADYIFNSIYSFNPASVGVVVEATHFCVEMRGVQKPGITTVTSALRGEFKTDPAQRAEVMALLTQR